MAPLLIKREIGDKMNIDTQKTTAQEDKPLTRTDVERMLHDVGSSDKLILHRENMAGIDLRRFNLARADLSEADLTRAVLSGADLKGAYLRGAYLLLAEKALNPLHT
jgi:uncharacterized protein YjbI with pentapeptide repeats